MKINQVAFRTAVAPFLGLSLLIGSRSAIAGDFSDKVILITGGSRGIGQATALAFAKAGGTVSIGFEKNATAAQAVVREIIANGGKASRIQLDVSDERKCVFAVQKVMKMHQGLDVLVNNAGIAIDKHLIRTDRADWERQLAINLNGAFFLSKAAVKSVMMKRGGVIINMGSVIGQIPNTGQAAYSASKAALHALTRVIAFEYGGRGVRAVTVAPGFIDTEMTAKFTEDQRKAIKASIPLGRFGTAEDVADLVLFLAGPRAGYITGGLYDINGGMHMP